ncbi:hypothetical protein [Piscinibacter sp. HJYY11]|uniref:hypothetical protein n=1 Tax=Piscinibacter sp. HJYY11 TaxID=2801333 RepID=UPI00191F7D80|nr:hypothetical protein [Piscinibacter sp. HJYY11]MBL0727067.1 hypothetical protein [Piscinibacter sp. HJYY11]
MSWIRTLVFLLSCWWACSAAVAQSIEPAPDWQSADTAHFRINYRAAWRPQAERVARIAEQVYPRITQALQWEPRGRTEILLIDQYDLANGFSTPLPYNIIGVYMAPPDSGELLDNSDWLELLITHEFTHTVHLDKVRGFPSVLQSIFGRQPFFFPNVFQPNWMVEGLAVYQESEPGTGRGRLRGPVFEAWLRAEAGRGFLSLRELNANGRALPLSKSYLYGAYFFDFLARRYGKESVTKVVHHYSGNPPFWPRLHNSPYEATGKQLDVLWAEFLADLQQQVRERSQPLKQKAEVAGERLAGPMFGVGAVAALPGGETLAVLEDGLHHAKLVKIAKDGKQTVLADVNGNAELHVNAKGEVLLSQPDVCNWRYLAYDVYRVDADGDLRQLTHCARLRRAVQAGGGIVALQQGQGITRLVQLDAQGRQQRVLWEPPGEINLIDLAVSPDGQQLAVASKRAGAWRVDAFDLSQPTPAPRLLFTHDAPVHGLVHGPKGLEFIAVRDGVFNVYRLEGGAWVKLSHTHTRVTAQGGTQDDGSLAMAVVAPGGFELRRLGTAAPLERAPAATAASAPAPAPAAVTNPVLGAGRSYSALRSVYPRAWFPVSSSDRGLFSVGASVFGADALGWHQYAATLAYEVTQHEPVGAVQYLFRDQHVFTLQRTLTPRAWVNGDDTEDVRAFDRNTSAQWLSVVPWLRLDRRVLFGVGAALDHVERVHPEAFNAPVNRTERMLAGLFEYDTTGGGWWSEGDNRGQKATLLYESYRPFARDGRNDYDGDVVRLDWRGFVPVGRSVIALRHTEAWAEGLTEPFQLGGAVDPQLQFGLALNNRDITLRGYRGNERVLLGRKARVTSFEFRTPIADIDRHFMVPAVGINRVSAAAFFDIGGAWDTGNRPLHYSRGVGVEVLADLKLLYALGFQVRIGLAQGLDAPKGTRGYFTLGRAF